MLHDPITIATACFAVILLGLAKGGFSAVGAMAMPIFAMAVPPTAAAAILLPVLLVQDVVSVWAFRKTWDRWVVAWMLPGGIVGIVLGYLLAAHLSISVVKGVLGVITLGFALYRLWVERGGRIVAASTSPGWIGGLFGVAAGFTSQIAHSGAPPFQMWVTPRKLPHLVFAGTGAILFATLNWIKVPFFMALGEFTHENLAASALLMPLALASTFAGVWIMRRINPERFYKLIYLLMVLLGAKLAWDGFAV